MASILFFLTLRSEKRRLQGEDSTTSCIMGIPLGLLGAFGDWWHVCRANRLFPGYADTRFPLVQVFPGPGNFFHFLRPIAR